MINNTNKREIKIIEQLCRKKAEIAQKQQNEKKKGLWQKVNQLEEVRPLVWINEIPWHEMEINNELTPKCDHQVLKEVEKNLRKTLYKWENMRADMVVENKLEVPLEIEISGFGYEKYITKKKQDNKSNVYAQKFEPQISSEKDLNKIKKPEIDFDAERTHQNYKLINNIASDYLEVKKGGWKGIWFAPVDELSKFWGGEKLLIDIMEKPSLVHKGMKKIMEGYQSLLQQIEDLDLLRSNNSNARVGSGGYGYTEELPEQDDFESIPKSDIWGTAAAQIFACVSPKRHKKFALEYEKKWLEDFGIAYYGCCEPLHNKIDILREIKNLKKISISPWADTNKAAEKIGRDYVISYKPSPAVLAENNWKLSKARKQLREDLSKLKGLNIEIIMKDISTVNYEPRRLWEWSEMAVSEAQNIF